jgi:hypothetical protein
LVPDRELDMKPGRVRSLCTVMHYLRMAGSRQVAWLLDTFEGKYGHLASNRARLPVSSAKEPLPWYTYPAIEYLSQLDFSTKDVFEFGSGNGSRFWAARAKSVMSVEHNPEWYVTVKKEQRANQTILLQEDLEMYAASIGTLGRKFDIIVVDGANRFQCAKNSIRQLATGGMLILDNSDWHPRTAGLLREAGLIEVDFIGFGPVNNYTWTTSLFLDRAVQIIPKSGRLPEYGIGSLTHDRDPSG